MGQSRSGVILDDRTDRVDWTSAKRLLGDDEFDNGRSADALRRSFDNSQHVVFAWSGDQIVGMARLLSDGVCNAYLLDVWTSSKHRRHGIGSRMVRHLLELVPGQHVGLQTDDALAFYGSLGFGEQPVFLSTVVGHWLANDQNGVTERPGGTR